MRAMGTKSRETIYGASVRAAAERAREVRKEADRLTVEAWNKRMLAFKGPAQPSPTLGEAINGGYGYLNVRCLGCDTNQTVALEVIRGTGSAGWPPGSPAMSGPKRARSKPYCANTNIIVPAANRTSQISDMAINHVSRVMPGSVQF